MAKWRVPIIAGLMGLAVAARLALFPHLSIDMTEFLVPWYDYIVEHGGYKALRDSFSNYPPAYTYLLVVATYLRPFLPKVTAIKLLAVVFDFLAAAVMHRLVRLKHRSGPLPWVAFFAVLFAPTILINSAYWGQCDSIYGTFLLASIYLVLARRPLFSMLSLALAFAFKPQAVFLAPFVLILLLKRQVPRAYTLLTPAVYLLLALPAALLGRPLSDLLSLYAWQTRIQKPLSMNAPSVHVFIPAAYHSLANLLGYVAAASTGLVIAVAALKSKVSLSGEVLLKAATLSVVAMPFLLPKMHDRYFYAADLISIGLAFYCPRLILIPILFQCTSGIAYTPFLVGREVLPLRLAAAGNGLATGLLFLAYLSALYPLRSPGAAKPAGDGNAGGSKSA